MRMRKKCWEKWLIAANREIVGGSSIYGYRRGWGGWEGSGVG